MSKTQTEWIIEDKNPSGTFYGQQDAVVEVRDHTIEVRLADTSECIVFTFDETVALRKALKQALKAASKVGVV